MGLPGTFTAEARAGRRAKGFVQGPTVLGDEAGVTLSRLLMFPTVILCCRERKVTWAFRDRKVTEVTR